MQIYGENWLPSGSSLQISLPPRLPLDSKVCSLFSTSGQWDSVKVHSAFHPDEALAILSIPVGEWVGEDKQIWHYENNCDFLVCSGYRLAQLVDLRVIPSSSSSSMIGWWKGLWNLSIPSKKFVFSYGVYV